MSVFSVILVHYLTYFVCLIEWQFDSPSSDTWCISFCGSQRTCANWCNVQKSSAETDRISGNIEIFLLSVLLWLNTLSVYFTAFCDCNRACYPGKASVKLRPIYWKSGFSYYCCYFELEEASTNGFFKRRETVVMLCTWIISFIVVHILGCSKFIQYCEFPKWFMLIKFASGIVTGAQEVRAAPGGTC